MYELTDNELLYVYGGESKVRLYLQKMASIGIYMAIMMGIGAPFITHISSIDTVLDLVLQGGFLGLGIGFFVAKDEYGPLPEGAWLELLNFDW